MRPFSLVSGGLLVAVGSLSVAACGGSRAAETTEAARGAIVGGEVDDADKAAVALAFSAFGFFSQHCSGTLIAPNLVLTARHCVALTQNNGPENSVDCAQTNFGMQAGGPALRATVSTSPPREDGPDWYPGVGTVAVPAESAKICGNDLALITLAGAGIPADVATPIVPRIDSSPLSGEPYTAIGFGLTNPSDNTSSGTRMRIDDNQVSCTGEECSAMFQVEPSEWMGDSRTCPGDSGGPAIDAEGRVMGVLSRGPTGCLSSVYGDVASHRDLIVETALAAAKSGGYEPPFWATTGSSTLPSTDDGGADAAPSGGALGDACDARHGCADGALCYATDGSNGTCVAACGGERSCPDGTRCDATLGACLAPAASGGGSAEGGGCALARGPARPVPWLVGALAGLGALLRRRRR
ncbi:MAG: trypsin-like serine protease [Sorangiineae bacterium]|nr:trypsin-like serine protease [Polyangiaceae bacterium]MEB2321671.1 trypsin-like serine protease [Sorangiineae bacterium]